MMRLNSLKPGASSRKSRKRIGRGHGSGSGKTASKGHKGQKARSGGVKGPGFEGGQMPLSRLLPKRGFVNHFRKNYQIVNLGQLEGIEKGAIVNAELLKKRGLIGRLKGQIKILADGEVKVPITIQVNAFSKKAKEKILAAGGKAEVI